VEITSFRRNDHACRPVLCVSGEVDLLVRDELSAALRQLILDAHSPAYLELSEVTFFDSSGVGALIEAQNLADIHDVQLIISPSHYVSTTIRILGLTERFRWGVPPDMPAAPA
jgi:anti-anti-sigma factor